jgi:hypothetical protein
MAFYSDEKRPVLAKWIKYTLFINVLIFILLVFIWMLMAGPSAAITHTGLYATLLIGLNVAAFLIYEQLYRPDDDPWRRAAEILGSLQVFCSCLTFLVLLGTIALAFSPGLAGSLPVLGGSQQPVPTATLPPVTLSSSPVTQTLAKPTECYQTSTGCVPYLPAATIPPYGTPVSQNDPIIGSFVFDKTQFDPKMNYYTRAGNYEYNYKSVPLDHSPDIKWTFRDDGVLLFYDTTKGNLLRTGTWTKTDLGMGKAEYRIKRGNYDYRGTFQDDAFRVTWPDFWNMTKVA